MNRIDNIESTHYNPYRFAFNGQEKIDEIAGAGNHNTAEFWEYDTRTGRRWNIDPMSSKYPWQSPYAVFNNNPIFYKDILGLQGTNPDEPSTNVSNKNSTEGQGITLPVCEIYGKKIEPKQKESSLWQKSFKIIKQVISLPLKVLSWAWGMTTGNNYSQPKPQHSSEDKYPETPPSDHTIDFGDGAMGPVYSSRKYKNESSSATQKVTNADDINKKTMKKTKMIITKQGDNTFGFETKNKNGETDKRSNKSRDWLNEINQEYYDQFFDKEYDTMQIKPKN